MKKKNIVATAAAVTLAAIVALGGGSLAYFTWTSTEIENIAANNYNWVSLTETGEDGDTTIGGSDSSETVENTSYEIIPGTSQDKNPTVTASYSLDSYVFVEVTDTSDGLITWAAADGWTLLEGTDEYDSEGNPYVVYYRLVTTEDVASATTSTGDKYYVQSFSVLDGNSISYSSAIGNNDVLESVDEEGVPTFLKTDFRLIFLAYIMQADIAGTSIGEEAANESALACWNAMNASSSTNTVAAGNVGVETIDDVTSTTNELVVTSDDAAYSATVPAGVTIDTDTADIVTDSTGKTTTTLILVVENIGANYSPSVNATVTTSAGESATVYDIYIIGVDDSNTTVMEIAMNIGTDLYNVEVEHEGADMTALEARASSGDYTDQTYYYNSAEGILYIYTSTFSEFAVYSMESAYVTSNGETGYSSLEEAIEAENVVVNEDTNVVYSTLTSAIKDASAGDTVTMLADMTENVTISKSITLDLGENTLTGTNASSISGAVTIGNGVTTTITNGTITGSANGIWNNSTSMDLTLENVTISNNSYYGIYINSSSVSGVEQVLTIKDGTVISGNKRGVYGTSLTVTMSGGEIKNNSGEGVWVTKFTMDGGTISGNSSYGVYGGTFVMNGGTISSNSNSGVYGANITINDGSITDNTAKTFGGGIYLTSGTLTINGGSITNNSGKTYGGGICCGGGTFTMTAGEISGNSSTFYGTGVALLNSASASISGGSILNNNKVTTSATTNNTNNLYKASGASYTITGGTFSFSPTSSYVASGYTATLDSDSGYYTVAESH